MSIQSQSRKRSKQRKRKPISQEHPMGCGLACIAYLTGKSYARVHRLVKHKNYAWTRGYYCSELVKILSQLGLTYSWSVVKRALRSDEIPVGSIVFISHNAEYPQGHFVVKAAKNRFMNPWINFPSIKNVRAGFQQKIGEISYVIRPD